MDRLPGEVLLEIFLLLHQTDKVACMRVCKKWEYTVREFCLLHTLCISTRKQMKKLIQIFKKEPHKRELVDRVFVFSRKDIFPFLTQLLFCIPKPREVCLPSLYLDEGIADHETFQKWTIHVKYITEYIGFQMTAKLLGSNVFSRLETLSLYNDSRNYNNLPKLIKVLPNAPGLKELRLKFFEATIDSMEAIHMAAPSLELICFSDVVNRFAEDAPRIPSCMKIQPAISMKSFALSLYGMSVSIEDTTNFFEYVGMKYPNLEILELAKNERYMDISHKKEIYSNALIPLCQKFGPQLKKLTTFIPSTIQDMFKWMDDTTCRIKDLDLEVLDLNFDDFKNAKQPAYIEKLALSNISCSNFSQLENCTVLTELRLSYKLPRHYSDEKHKIKFDHLIKACPKTVKALLLANVEIQYDKTTEIQLLAMRNLYFERTELTDGLDQFIAKTFPQLRILKFHYCNMSYKTFVFPDLRLFRLQIDDVFTKKKKPTETLLVMTTDNNERRLYKKMQFKVGESSMGVSYTKYDKSIHPENKQMDLDRFKHDPLIIIECASVKNIMY